MLKTITVVRVGRSTDKQENLIRRGRAGDGEIFYMETFLAESVDFGPTGILYIYKGGDLYRAFNVNEWLEVTVEENRIQGLD
jgi:hypothetical protein